MRRAGFVCVLLGVFAIVFAGVLAALNWVGTDSDLYFRLQMKAGILDEAGVSAQDLTLMDACLAECLKGDPQPIELLHVNVNGKVQRAFNDRELAHMEDCRRLFELSRHVLTLCEVAGPVLLILGLCLLRDRKKARLAARLAPHVLLLPLGALAIWAAVDFDAAFGFFHRVLFTNDLWLLDPRTDLLIRVCPQSMFASMGIRIGALGLVWMLLVPTVVSLCTLIGRRRKVKKVYELHFEDEGEG